MEVSSIQSEMAIPREVTQAEQPSKGPSFGKVLLDAVTTVNQSQNDAQDAARDFAIGQANSLHETMITIEKADISLRLLTQIRSKAVEAYQEIMRMQV